MEFLQALLPSSSLFRLESYTIESGDCLLLTLSSTQAIIPCPLCGGLTHRIHSHYERTLADLPCVHFRLRLILQVCKFFCPNTECRRRIFTERLPEVAAPWARKTVRLIQRLQSIGLALGGAAGARLGDCLGYAACGSTLMNQLQQLPLPDVTTPKVLGVDDFAFRKGHNYGTILVDLETHQPIALLADRKAETLVEWLQAHLGIEVLSRDRSKTYKRAMTEGAPEAIQVADRFHLVKNLSETLEQAFGSYRSELKAAEQSQHQIAIADAPEETVLAMPKPTATETSQQQIHQNQQRKIDQQKTIKSLRAQGWLQTAIAQTVGVSLKTVERYSTLPDFPEIPPRRPTFGRSLLDPYKPQLLDWWNSGIREPSLLMKLLKPCGFEGSLRTVQRYLSGLREAQGLPPVRIKVAQALPKVVDPQSPPFTPRQAAYLVVLKPDNRQAEETDLLERVVQQHPDLSQLVVLADAFLQLLRQRQADAFDDWLLKAARCALKPLQTFAKGLFDDYAAVKASLMTEVSNGPVEGLNNKLKMLKRQMYGRANLELLAKRFIMAA
ncbi:ISL3 family transposase [Phormidium tenue]|uniref:ISL3 family transposase n=1 Tax=Phormidium tenue NIES-30 TaxID=549789 RepID=A0A1U7IXY8_9CYAN|nr:ISL3 family transposase [Phormidium tenue]MBD2234978.1 ISL3 family transposase [Phormidium tenue FACHB-1052]OKH43145.1 ISL3 family transposase [Phormidium tenue NIES-30]